MEKKVTWVLEMRYLDVTVVVWRSDCSWDCAEARLHALLCFLFFCRHHADRIDLSHSSATVEFGAGCFAVLMTSCQVDGVKAVSLLLYPRSSEPCPLFSSFLHLPEPCGSSPQGLFSVTIARGSHHEQAAC